MLFGYVNESFVAATAAMAVTGIIGEGTCVVIVFPDEILDAVRRSNGGVSSVELLPMYVTCGMSDDRVVGECLAVACE